MTIVQFLTWAFVALSAADTATTLLILSRGGYESNDFLAGQFRKHGAAATLLTCKLAACAIVVLLAWRYPDHLATKALLSFAWALMIWVVAHNVKVAVRQAKKRAAGVIRRPL